MRLNPETRRQLELAAKAAGITHLLGAWFNDGLTTAGFLSGRLCNGRSVWNPADDSGDAFRLAVVLGFLVRIDNHEKITQVISNDYSSPVHREPHKGDPAAATRMAILRAAAAIGEVTP